MFQDNYEKEYKYIDKTKEDQEIDLIFSIVKAKEDLYIANCNFEYAKDDLIDYYAYQIKANRAKFDYLLKKAKQKGLSLNMIEQISIKLNKAI